MPCASIFSFRSHTVTWTEGAEVEDAVVNADGCERGEAGAAGVGGFVEADDAEAKMEALEAAKRTNRNAMSPVPPATSMHFIGAVG